MGLLALLALVVCSNLVFAKVTLSGLYTCNRWVTSSMAGSRPCLKSSPEELEIMGAGGLLRRQPCAKVWLR